MKLQEFIKLNPEHDISFEDGQELHKDIALNGTEVLKSEQAILLCEYLEKCLLHRSVEPSLINKLESTVLELRKISNDN